MSLVIARPATDAVRDAAVVDPALVPMSHVAGVTPTTIDEGLGLLIEGPDEQTPSDGIGTLEIKRFFADLRDARVTPSALLREFPFRFDMDSRPDRTPPGAVGVRPVARNSNAVVGTSGAGGTFTQASSEGPLTSRSPIFLRRDRAAWHRYCCYPSRNWRHREDHQEEDTSGVGEVVAEGYQEARAGDRRESCDRSRVVARDAGVDGIIGRTRSDKSGQTRGEGAGCSRSRGDRIEQVAQGKKNEPPERLDTCAADRAGGIEPTAGLTGTVQHLVRNSKDAALAVAARAFLNRQLEGVGQVESLAVDTAARSVQVQLGLLGEAESVWCEIRRYLIHASDRGATVTVVDARASRPWLDKVLQAFVIGRPLAVPSKLAFALKMLV